MENSKFEGVVPIASYTTAINQIITQANQKFGSRPCTQIAANSNASEITLTYFQPYIALILSDLLIATGSNDAAISVLTHWLDLSASIRRKVQHDASHANEWFQLRVASRVFLLLGELAGQSTSNYRDFFWLYKNRFESYFRSSKNPITLDQLPAKCKNIANVPVIEQKILFLLLAYENEASKDGSQLYHRGGPHPVSTGQVA